MGSLVLFVYSLGFFLLLALVYRVLMVLQAIQAILKKASKLLD